jgi:predicted alpha/beta superfamily hydrolase
LESFIINVTPFRQERMIRIYLPYGYTEGTKHYPVLYMHDGQTVFRDEDVADGISLRLKEYLDNMRAEVIVIGIDSNVDGNKRVNEYSPWENFDFSRSYMNDGELLGGKAEEYLEFIIHELMPLINNKYRTASNISYMAGCSMGGLFSTYAGCRYPEVFTKVAALSSSYWFNQTEIEDLIRGANLESNTGFYLDCGTEEGNDEKSKSDFIQSQRAVYHLLREKIRHIRFNIINDAGHNLLAFRDRLPDVISFFDIRVVENN